MCASLLRNPPTTQPNSLNSTQSFRPTHTLNTLTVQLGATAVLMMSFSTDLSIKPDSTYLENLQGVVPLGSILNIVDPRHKKLIGVDGRQGKRRRGKQRGSWVDGIGNEGAANQKQIGARKHRQRNIGSSEDGFVQKAIPCCILHSKSQSHAALRGNVNQSVSSWFVMRQVLCVALAFEYHLLTR